MYSIGGIAYLRPKSILFRKFYDWKTSSDTIFAAATTINSKKGSPLAIVRVSGNETTKVIEGLTNRIAFRDNQSPISKQIIESRKILKARHVTINKIIDPRSKELIDIGLVLWFPKPNSYTGEDICEFHVHGSQAIMTKLMAILSGFENLRPAEPGEFTRRAVFNEKLSLIQAESLPELIAAQTDQQRKLALQGLVGSTRRKYDKWTEDLVKILAHLEASIDFGEDELIGEQLVVNECISNLNRLHEEIEKFINFSSRCRDLIQFGSRVAILGRPNAGKSTFMNMLCRKKKSIVSDLSGTTRDVIEYSFDLDGHTITLCDTAGLKEVTSLGSSKHKMNSDSSGTVLEQHNSIEKEGIRRALDAARVSNLIIYLVDSIQLMDSGGPESIANELSEIFSILRNDQECQSKIKLTHLVINKIDLCHVDKNGHQKQQQLVEKKMKELESSLKAMPQLSNESFEISQLSCKTQENFEFVLEKISNSLTKLSSTIESNSADSADNNNNNVDLDYVNERHLSLLRSTSRHLGRAKLLDIRTIDEMAQHVRESVDYLSRIVGHVTNEQVIDLIFRDFCIGK